MSKIKMGMIEDGGLKGKKIILKPRKGLKKNEYLIEQGYSLMVHLCLLYIV